MVATPTALLSFDFDGTLASAQPEWKATQQLHALLENLRSAKAAWIINTGRSLYHTLDGLAQHGIPAPPDFIIARESEIYTLSQYNRWIDVGDWNKRLAKEASKFYKKHASYFRTLKKWLQETTQATWIAEPQEPAGIVATSLSEMDAICRWIEGSRGRYSDLDYQRNSVYLRFTPRTHNKGCALAELARMLDIDVDHRFAIGDSHNDLSMLQPEVAGCLACPSNAVHEVHVQVLEHGGYRAKASATEGCIEALHYFFFD